MKINKILNFTLSKFTKYVNCFDDAEYQILRLYHEDAELQNYLEASKSFSI